MICFALVDFPQHGNPTIVTSAITCRAVKHNQNSESTRTSPPILLLPLYHSYLCLDINTMSRRDNETLPPIREALDPIATPYLSSMASTVSGNFSIAKEVLMGSFTSDHRRSESTRILSDRMSPSTHLSVHICKVLMDSGTLFDAIQIPQSTPCFPSRR